MFSESSPCLLGQNGSCSTAHQPWNSQKTFAKTFRTSVTTHLVLVSCACFNFVTSTCDEAKTSTYKRYNMPVVAKWTLLHNQSLAKVSSSSILLLYTWFTGRRGQNQVNNRRTWDFYQWLFITFLYCTQAAALNLPSLALRLGLLLLAVCVVLATLTRQRLVHRAVDGRLRGRDSIVND